MRGRQSVHARHHPAQYTVFAHLAVGVIVTLMNENLAGLCAHCEMFCYSKGLVFTFSNGFTGAFS